jgi:hypothetical protein
MPFKEYDSMASKSYHINDPVSVKERKQCVKEILEAKYVPAGLEQICSSCTHLQIEQQKKLLDLLQKYEDLFDGSLGKWNGTEVNIELKEGATPYHAKAYPIPKCHVETLKMEVQRLVELGVPKEGEQVGMGYTYLYHSQERRYSTFHL